MKMNIFLRRTVPMLALFFVLTGSAWAQQAKMATVDLQKVFDNYWKTKQADTLLKEQKADMEKEYKNMITDYNKSKEEYQKLLTSANDLVLSAEERDKRKKAAED